MTDRNNKRTAPSVQDVINGNDGAKRARFKSGYSGPKKPPRVSTQMSQTSSFSVPSGSSGPGTRIYARSGGILDYAWIAYCAVLAIAVATALLSYRFGGNSGKIYYPSNVITMSGVINNILDDYKHGGLGSGYSAQASTTPGSTGTTTAAADTSATTDPNVPAAEGENPDNSSLLGESTASTTPNSTTGATMALDTGSSYGSYGSATSFQELLQQLDTALAANDSGFVGTKLAYEDAESKTLIGYPESVVAHFTKYMSDNPDKRASFLDAVKDEATFCAKNGAAVILKLPLLQFTINMGYDDTTISISGFADQKMDAGQSAVVSPLLPCMYTINATTSKGAKTSEVECNMNEGNLQINIGVTN